MLDVGARERPTHPEGPEKGRPSVLAIIALIGVLTLVGFGLIAYLVADRATGAAKWMLPAPEILSVRLDEEHTYVYKRTTGLLAERNEQLESKARQEALRAIGDAAREGDVMEKARKQAERQVQQLLEKFGVNRTTIGWGPS